ncbi:MAG TPA: hypothetical protein VG245_00965 [Candidatus Dormibacteraeota bacterium]|nr:hypothetical protein [Candidatus Dormibacteraeota bacterium]
MTPGVLLGRARRAWFPLLFVLLFGWLDWLSHHDPVVAVGGVVLAVAGILLWPEIAARLGLTALLQRVPQRFRPVLFAIPGLAFVLVRTQSGGASGQTTQTVAAISLVSVVVLSFLGPAIDRRLAGWYSRRNVVPRLPRMVLAPLLAVVLSYLIVHGAPADLPTLAGVGAASAATTPSSTLAVLASLVAAAVSFLLLREPAPD